MSRSGLNAGALALALGMPGVARADSGISVTADQALRFGSFVVPASGSRTVSASGTVTDSGVFAVAGSSAGPAQFTVTYERGGDGGRTINILVQVLLASAPGVTQGGVTGTLSGFETDLPGIASLLPGQAKTFIIANCTQRICSRTFRVGARLAVTRASGGAALTIPVPVTATVLAVL